MVFAEILDPVMSPLLSLDPLFAVGLVSLVVSVIITVIYKYTTNQSLMKDLKGEMKEFQKEIKELRDKPEQAMKVQKEMMQTNMKYMSHSFRSTLFTMLPIILIFGWMNVNFAYEPINPDEPFAVNLNFAKNAYGNISVTTPEGIEIVGEGIQEIKDGKTTFVFKGTEGTYIEGNALKFDYNGGPAFKDVIITTGQGYTEKTKKGSGHLKNIDMDYKKKIILPVLNWGWLGAYIIFSIIFSMTIRKWMKVY